MATFADQYTMATTPAFIQRVEIALVTAAINTLTEPENTPDHSFRRAYAASILANPALQAAVMAMGVATNATIAVAAPTGASALDSDIQFTVNSMFNSYSLR
jgi:hypothetical protein